MTGPLERVIAWIRQAGGEARRRVQEAGGALQRLLAPSPPPRLEPPAGASAAETGPTPANDHGPSLTSPAFAEERIYAIGDIHGRADLLEDLLRQIYEDAADCASPPHLVYLGDYMDRGFESRRVLDILLSDTSTAFQRYYLKGNHEAAMLRFLRDYRFGPQWAQFGGSETLVSYGVQPPRIRTDVEDWRIAQEALVEALPQSHLDFLNSLSLIVRLGQYAFVHAGVRPGRPLDEQEENDLLWIREPFLQDKSRHEAVIVHGHTPLRDPYADERRIAVDTGAYLTGRLTAVRLEGQAVDFIMTNT